jgi:hypothetical protein
MIECGNLPSVQPSEYSWEHLNVLRGLDYAVCQFEEERYLHPRAADQNLIEAQGNGCPRVGMGVVHYSSNRLCASSAVAAASIRFVPRFRISHFQKDRKLWEGKEALPGV